jgi:hypothetical protein
MDILGGLNNIPTPILVIAIGVVIYLVVFKKKKK